MTKEKKKIAYCHCLLHNTTTIKECDDIAAITFFAAKPPKKAKVTIFLQQSHQRR
jgi:hypothetical protein